MTTQKLAAPIIVSEFWKNRAHQSIRLTLTSWRDRNIVDVRIWEMVNGKLRPTLKGIAADLKHLPRLTAAFRKAEAKARKLGLIPAADDGGDQ